MRVTEQQSLGIRRCESQEASGRKISCLLFKEREKGDKDRVKKRDER